MADPIGHPYLRTARPPLPVPPGSGLPRAIVRGSHPVGRNRPCVLMPRYAFTIALSALLLFPVLRVRTAQLHSAGPFPDDEEVAGPDVLLGDQRSASAIRSCHWIEPLQ